MNSINRQHAIREYELFFSSGVQEIPEGVFERETRTSGEYRVVRAQQQQTALVLTADYPGIVLGEAAIDLRTGQIMEDAV